MKEITHIDDNFELDLEDDLEEIDLIMEERVHDELPSPRLEIEGITTAEELSFLKSSILKSPSNTSLPLYVRFGLDKVESGYLDLDLNKILELRFIGSNRYRLSLIAEEGSVDILSPSLGDIEVERLINFIRIK